MSRRSCCTRMSLELKEALEKVLVCVLEVVLEVVQLEEVLKEVLKGVVGEGPKGVPDEVDLPIRV